MVAQTRRRNRRAGSLFLVAFLLVAAMVSASVYAATSNTNTLTITAPSTTSGAKADVSSVASAFIGVQGQGKKTEGVVLSKLTLGNSDDSDSTAIEFIWTDPGEAGAVLLNPNAFLETRVYFLDTDQQPASAGGYSGSCDSASQRSFDDGGTTYVCPDPDETHNFKTLSVSNAAAHFLPSVDGQSVLYILADIAVPVGAPPGQQSQLTELTFIVGVN